MIKRIITALFVLIVFIANSKEYYVSPNGNDANNGSIDKPFKSIKLAVKSLQAGDICYLRAGTYNEVVDLTNLKGTLAKPITIKAYNNEKVVFSGSKPVKGKWTKESDNIYSLKVKTDIWQLFENGKTRILARWPNASFDDGSIWDMKSTWRHQSNESEFGIIYDERPIDADYINNDDEGASAFEVKEGVNLETLGETGIDFTGATAVLNIGSWLSWAQPVVKHEAGSNAFEYSKDFSRPGKPAPNGPSLFKRDNFFEAKKNQGHYYMVGLMALDAPNEWFYNAKEKKVYVFVEDGNSPDDFEFQGKYQDFNLKGKNVSNVTISGIDFFATTFKFANSNNVTVENSHLLYPSYNKIALLDYRDPEVTGFLQSRADFAKKIKSNNVIYNCVFEYADGPGFKIKGVGDRVENCYFHDIDWTCLGSGSSGTLDASGTEGFVFRNNTVHTGGNSEGVRIGHGNLVEFNHIYNLSLLQHDGSGINVGTNHIDQTIIRNNWVHDMKKSGIRFDSRGYNTVLVEWGENGTIDHNVVWNTGSIKAKGNRHKITNNIAFGSIKGMYDIGVPRVLVMGSNNSKSVITCNLSGSIGGHFAQRKGYECPGTYENNIEDDVTNWLVDPLNGDFRPKKDVVEKMFCLESKGNIGAYSNNVNEYWIPGCELEQTSVPVPFDGAKNIQADLVMFWKDAYEAEAYEIYMGTDKTKVLKANNKSKEFKGKQSENYYKPEGVDGANVYYWRVDAIKQGEIIKGNVWSFGGADDSKFSYAKPKVKPIKYREVAPLPNEILSLKLGDEKEAQLYKVYNNYWSGYDNYKWYTKITKMLESGNLNDKKKMQLEEFYSSVMQESLEYLIANSSDILNEQEQIELSKLNKNHK